MGRMTTAGTSLNTSHPYKTSTRPGVHVGTKWCAVLADAWPLGPAVVRVAIGSLEQDPLPLPQDGVNVERNAL
jgi:hypothetical protein